MYFDTPYSTFISDGSHMHAKRKIDDEYDNENENGSINSNPWDAKSRDVKSKMSRYEIEARAISQGSVGGA
jgi:hypothetical protein